jgi:UDP-GlcNAc:undecaprenyl-phosphate GlcNAc-1-phosphate transferase
MPLPISVSIFFGALLSFAIAPWCIRLANRLGMIDQPGGSPHKIHAVATPRAGGMVIFATTLIVGAYAGLLTQPPLSTILLGSALIFALGMWDDATNISSLTKLMGQILAALVLIRGGVVVQFLHFPPADFALTLFWVVGVTNAYNLVDSMDGEAIGLAILTAGFLLLATINSGQTNLTVFSAILIGACAGLLYYNLTPARLFLGDSGSQLLGFWLAALGIIYTPSRTVPQLSSWFVPILLMIVPILDTTLVTISRLRAGVAFYQPNRDHTYHRLIALGVPPLHAVFLIHLVSTAAGCLAFIALELPPLWANSIFLAALLAGVAAILWLGRQKVI